MEKAVQLCSSTVFLQTLEKTGGEGEKEEEEEGGAKMQQSRERRNQQSTGGKGVKASVKRAG